MLHVNCNLSGSKPVRSSTTIVVRNLNYVYKSFGR